MCYLFIRTRRVGVWARGRISLPSAASLEQQSTALGHSSWSLGSLARREGLWALRQQVNNGQRAAERTHCRAVTSRINYPTSISPTRLPNLERQATGRCFFAPQSTASRGGPGNDGHGRLISFTELVNGKRLQPGPLPPHRYSETPCFVIRCVVTGTVAAGTHTAGGRWRRSLLRWEIYSFTACWHLCHQSNMHSVKMIDNDYYRTVIFFSSMEFPGEITVILHSCASEIFWGR